MYRLFTTLLLTYLAQNTLAQSAKIHIDLLHSEASSCTLYVPEWGFMQDYLKKATIEIPLDKQGSGSFVLPLDRPVQAWFYYGPADQIYSLFLSPGDSLIFKADSTQTVEVTGRGAQNNQPLLGSAHLDFEDQLFAGDTLPDRILPAINLSARRYDSLFQVYKQRFHPTEDFVRIYTKDLAYFKAAGYFGFKENNKYKIQDAFYRNHAQWQRAQDSLFAQINLDDPSALGAHNYTRLLANYLLRTKEALWREATDSPAVFCREWYDTTVTAGMAMFQADVQNLLKEKIIHHYFKNPAVVAYLYAAVIEDALAESNPDNLVEIYDRFKQSFPQDPYVSTFEPYIRSIKERETGQLNSAIVFAPDSGVALHSMEDLLALVKGKTVLLDMWGTWCSPCREEIQQNSQAIRDHFKGKGLDYLYVANFDQGNAQKWKKLIGYFNMEGTHVLAGQGLTKDILKKVKGTGFPSYVVIKRDGTYALSKAGYPMDRDVLIKQLEDALK